MVRKRRPNIPEEEGFTTTPHPPTHPPGQSPAAPCAAPRQPGRKRRTIVDRRP
jgi:hypothetical protein